MASVRNAGTSITVVMVRMLLAMVMVVVLMVMMQQMLWEVLSVESDNGVCT